MTIRKKTMSKKLIIPKRIVTSDGQNTILRNHIVEIENAVITSLRPFDADDIQNFNGEVINAPELTLIPGFVQTHIHLCQTLFRGLADNLELLD